MDSSDISLRFMQMSSFFFSPFRAGCHVHLCSAAKKKSPLCPNSDFVGICREPALDIWMGAYDAMSWNKNIVCSHHSGIRAPLVSSAIWHFNRRCRAWKQFEISNFWLSFSETCNQISIGLYRADIFHICKRQTSSNLLSWINDFMN